MDCVQFLLDKKADPLARNIYRKTPLDAAVEKRHSDVAVTFMKSAGSVYVFLLSMLDSDYCIQYLFWVFFTSFLFTSDGKI